jgi:uncharacterized membrane protein YfcA
MQYEILFITGLMLIAFFYATVGHGGASGYLALMALFGLAPDSIRFNALILNMFVSGIAFISYYRAGFFRWRLILPFLIGSVPSAYIGAQISINPTLYKILLGIFLLIAVIRLLFVRNSQNKPLSAPPIILAFGIGLALGLISGIIGIGGGILLSPILILAGFATTKEASAVSALFILLNSASGLAGLLGGPIIFQPHIVLWIAVVLASGLAGSAIGSNTFSEYKLKLVLSVVLLAASLKLFFY